MLSFGCIFCLLCLTSKTSRILPRKINSVVVVMVMVVVVVWLFLEHHLDTGFLKICAALARLFHALCSTTTYGLWKWICFGAGLHPISAPCLKMELFTIMLHDVTIFLAATKQLYKWFSPSVRPSVCPSVRPSHLFDYVPIIVSSWNFQKLYQWQKWRPCKRSRSEVKGQGHRGHNPT